nr:cupin domain-containing protein [Acetobacter oeni]
MTANASPLARPEAPVLHPTPGSTLQELLGATARLHSDRMSIALFTLAAGTTYPASHNITSEEIFLIHSGEGTIWLNGSPATVSAGDIVQIPPGADHSIEASRQKPLSFYAISAPPFRPEDTVSPH